LTAASAQFSARASPSALVAAKKMLGLSPTTHAAEEKVKAAFRKRALELHPDTNPGPGAEGKFIELQRCFEVAMAAAETAQPRAEEPLRREPFRPSRADSSHITFEEFLGNPDAFFAAKKRAREHDDAMRETLEKEAAAWCARDQHSVEELREGWREETHVSVRATAATGFKQVKTVRVRVTGPGPGDRAEEEFEEWVGDNGAPRRRMLMMLPSRFELARVTFGSGPFTSESQRRDAVVEFGRLSVAKKRLAAMFA